MCITVFFLEVMHYITINCNAKLAHYTLHPHYTEYCCHYITITCNAKLAHYTLHPHYTEYCCHYITITHYTLHPHYTEYCCHYIAITITHYHYPRPVPPNTNKLICFIKM
jgi:hypothetical protein